MKELYFITPLQVFLFTSLLTVLVLRGRSRSPVHSTLALTLLAMALWAIMILGMRTSSSLEAAILWEKGALVAIVAVPVFFYHFTCLFTRRESPQPLVGAYALAAVIAVLVGSGLVVPDMEERWYGYAPRFGPLYVPYLIAVYGLTFMGVRNLVAYYRDPPSRAARNRTTYVLLGVGCALVGGVLDSLPPLMAVYPVGMLGNLLFALFTAVAILKHNLLDVRVAIEKGFVYSVVSAVILGIYVALLFSLNLVFQDSVSPHSWPGSLAAVLTAAILLKPVLTRVQRVADRWFWRRRYDYLRALESFSHETRDITNLRQLGLVLEQSITLAMSAERVRLLVPSTRTGRFSSETDRGSRGVRPFTLRASSPIVAWLESHHGVLTQQDLQTEPEFLSLSGAERSMLADFKSELMIPLKSSGELAGILVLSKKRSEEPYSDEDLSLLNAAANQTAMGLANARLFASVVSQRTRLEQLLEKVIWAQEEERKRLSMELHDSPLQWLTSAVYRLEACLEYFHRGQEARARDELQEVQEVLDTTLAELRHTTVALHPPALEKVGLVEALSGYVAAFRRDTDIPCRFEADEVVPRLVAAAELAVYRVVQEALSNVRKHSKASEVHVQLGADGGWFRASVRDDGIGFEVEDSRRPDEGHLGLAGMEERARMLRGTLTIHSMPGAGTHVILLLPLAQEADSFPEDIVQVETRTRLGSEVAA